MESTQRILLINEVAAILRVAPVTIYRWLAERRAGRGNFPLPISQRGQKIRFLASDLENFLQSQSNAIPPIDTAPPSTKRLAQQERDVKDFQLRQRLAAETLQKHRNSRTK